MLAVGEIGMIEGIEHLSRGDPLLSHGELANNLTMKNNGNRIILVIH